MSGKFLDGHIRAYRGKGQDNRLTRHSPIYYSTASIPLATLEKIRHGKLLGNHSELCTYLLIESMICSPSGPKYDSDSDLEDDGNEQSEQSEAHNAGLGKV